MIKELIEKLCCKHDWQELKHIRVYCDSDKSTPIEHIFLYKCRKCGKFKEITI